MNTQKCRLDLSLKLQMVPLIKPKYSAQMLVLLSRWPNRCRTGRLRQKEGYERANSDGKELLTVLCGINYGRHSKKWKYCREIWKLTAEAIVRVNGSVSASFKSAKVVRQG